MPHAQDDTQHLYAIALSLVKYLGAQPATELVEAVGGVREVFTQPELIHQHFPRLSRRIANQLTAPSLLEEAQKILEECRCREIRPLFLLDEAYPSALKEIPSPPIVLYTKGSYTDWEGREHLSIVGTRGMTDYGRGLTRALVHDLAEYLPTSTIVSGLAYGVDIEAHEAALEEGLPTLAVLAHGLDTLYPSLHRRVAEHMLDQGAWVSEYPPGVKPHRGAFVARNRIIAGLSAATIVVEAGECSGSLSTARYALESSREVFAFPGRLTDPMSRGCHQLIEEQRAHLCLGARHILEELGWSSTTDQVDTAEGSSATTSVAKLPSTKVFPQHPLLTLLSEQGSLSTDELARLTCQSIQEVSSQLFDLELEGWVIAQAGGRYTLA